MQILPFARMRAVALVLSVMTTLALVSGLLVATGGTALASGSHTTSAEAGSTVDFAAMQKWCAVIEVHLNGTQHTITCLQTYETHRSLLNRYQPDLGRVPCYTGITVIQIWNYDYSGQLCFSGYGYLGVNIYQVNEVDNEAQIPCGNCDMWMRYYHGGPGITCTIHAYHSKYFAGAYTNVEVTQLDFGNTNGPTC